MRRDRRAWLAAAAAVTLLGVLAGGVPLLVGPPGGDDAYYHAMYAQQHARCWRGGVLHPRWYPDLHDGLGGPEPRSRPLAPLALHAAFALALDDAVAATTVATALIPPVAGLLMLWAARRRGAGATAAALAAAAWTVAPYLLLALHQRAALQEAWALALLPAVLAALLPGGDDTDAPLAGAGWLALLLATQLLVALMAGAILLAAAAATSLRRLARTLAAIGAALALSAFSWVPNVVSLRRIKGDVFSSGWFDWRSRFVLAGGDPDPLLAWHVLLAFAGIATAATLVAAVERGAPRRLAAGTLATLVLATPLSRWAWEVVPGLALVQFPWRWVGPAACLAALAIAACRRPVTRLVAAAALVAPVVAVPWLDWRLPSGAPLRPSATGREAADAATRYGVPAILPSFPATLPRGVDLAAALAAGAAARAALPPPSPAGPARWSWTVDEPAGAAVPLPLLRDDAWRAEVDGRRAVVTTVAGLVAVEAPAGRHRVTVRQALLGEEWLGAAISLLAAAALVIRGRRLAPP